MYRYINIYIFYLFKYKHIPSDACPVQILVLKSLRVPNRLQRQAKFEME